ncbi:hypothetical protein BDZ45DRAFT_692541 [Acephala macrosclerotiorum]|nr:hypothetical protein BDZ45DRAFT_692541 [Acephala macrosclerotiorum]
MPRSTHCASSGPLVPPSSGNNGRSRVEAKDLCVGCIVWLPSRAESNEDIKCNKQNCCNAELETGGYEHPVVVLSIRQKRSSHIRGDLVCTVACVTTFSSTSLSTYIIKRPRMRHMLLSIPIHDPATDSPDTAELNIEQLHLEKDNLHKQSYVCLQHTYEVPSSMLCRYHFRTRPAYELRLMEQSYNLLMVKLGAAAEPYVKTVLVPMAWELRLAVLAGSGGRTRRTSSRLPSFTTPDYVPPPSLQHQHTNPILASPRTSSRLPSFTTPDYVPPPSLPHQHTNPRYYNTIPASPRTSRHLVPPRVTPPYGSHEDGTGSALGWVVFVVGCIGVGALLYGSVLART